MSKTVQFQTIQFSISKQFKCKYSLIVKTFLFQAIQFNQAVLIQLIQPSIFPVHLGVVAIEKGAFGPPST